MKCPYCDSSDTKVIDSRATEDNTAIRRRRVCQTCNKRFSTYERYEDRTLMVIKKDNTRESFDRSKLINGIVKSCEKRPVSLDQIEEIADNLELKINHSGKKEVSSTAIGKFVCDKLKNLDPVAYVRFASVYREFKDVESFYEELKNLKDEN